MEGGSRGVSRDRGSSLGQLKGWEHPCGFLWAWEALSGWMGKGLGDADDTSVTLPGAAARLDGGQTRKGGMRLHRRPESFILCPTASGKRHNPGMCACVYIYVYKASAMAQW